MFAPSSIRRPRRILVLVAAVVAVAVGSIGLQAANAASTVRITLTSNVAVSMSLDGRSHTLVPNRADATSYSITVTAPANRTLHLSAPSPALDGRSTFVSWNGRYSGQTNIGIATGTSNATWAAFYNSPIEQYLDANPRVRSIVGGSKGEESGDENLRQHYYANGVLFWTKRDNTVRLVQGLNYQAFLRNGDKQALGLPTLNDEWATPDGRARYNHFTNGASSYWTPTTGAWVVKGAFHARWSQLGWEKSALGYPTSDEIKIRGGVVQRFERGNFYWTPQLGAYESHGDIFVRYSNLGWENSYLGFPTTDVVTDRFGSVQNFQGGQIVLTNEGEIYDCPWSGCSIP